jgi:hypothetical protein
LVEYFKKMHGRAKGCILLGIGSKTLSLDLDDASKNKGSPNQIAGIDDEKLN